MKEIAVVLNLIQLNIFSCQDKFLKLNTENVQISVIKMQ